jgi:hypothetical protein
MTVGGMLEIQPRQTEIIMRQHNEVGGWMCMCRLECSEVRGERSEKNMQGGWDGNCEQHHRRHLIFKDYKD